ncbi:MAG: peptidylprolyl isomerase [Candidatus Ornithomonoglobus sp.]
MKKTAAFLAVLMSAAIVLGGCGSKKNDKADIDEIATEKPTESVISNSEELAELTRNTIDAEIVLTNGEIIDIELYPDLAPKTVANFVKNVNEDFYTGTIFHRVIDGFMIQGGGYDEDCKLKSVSETVEGEFEDNGIENPLSHERGVISMARTSEPNSASTQFFIVQKDSAYLDGQYAAFGRVTAGMEVVDEIASAPKADDPPSGLNDLTETLYVIDSITIFSDVDMTVDEDTELSDETEADEEPTQAIAK